MAETLTQSPAALAVAVMPDVVPARVFIDLTHLGRHVTGIERVSIEQFEKVDFAQARVTAVRANGILSLILRQQIYMPLLALFYPRAMFVFPGFAPSPLFVFARKRVFVYVHDLFLITRPADLAAKAKAYMARPFAFAVKHLNHFQVNSQKTADELAPFVRAGATISLYRPAVRNVFALEPGDRDERPVRPKCLNFVTLGTVEPRKNYGAALAIVDELAKRGFEARLHIIGREGWGDAGCALKAHPRVTIHGYLPAEKVKVLMEGGDLYLCTSHDEGLGLPLLEAQFAGLAVVAPLGAVFREVLGTSAIFVDTSKPAAAAEAIAMALEARDWRQRTRGEALANVARWNGLAAHDAEIARAMFVGARG